MKVLRFTSVILILCLALSSGLVACDTKNNSEEITTVGSAAEDKTSAEVTTTTATEAATVTETTTVEETTTAAETVSTTEVENTTVTEEMPTTEAEITTATEEMPTTEAEITTATEEMPTTEVEITTATEEMSTTEEESTTAEETTTEEETTTVEETTTEETAAFEVEDIEGGVTVTLKDGFTYTASGYDSIDKKGFSFEGEMSFDFDDQFSEEFNRFTVEYYSSAPVKLYVTYFEDGSAKEEYYFLEAGKGSFSGLNVNFLDGKIAEKYASVRVVPCENEIVTFLVYGLSLEEIAVPERVIYIEGERYKLGIDLVWGGAISYAADKNCTVDGVENMINYHDPGRLVQQSYYGTGAIEGVFEWGSFNGSDRWPYNPVQGGDKGRCSSRLIDIVIEEDRVYIKAQPMDWGKVGFMTPSYMENLYIIEDDHIKVDNRFVDFSGWTHPYTAQELPAFYTISYLDTFYYYGGKEPWTGDTLTAKEDLPFWGSQENSGECSVEYRDVNSELWCAWVNPDDDYGIGLYVPNIDRLSVGRSQYNGTKDPAGNPTNYVAPIKKIKLVSYEALEYSYMICAGSLEEIRATFTEYKDFTANENLSVNSVDMRLTTYDGDMRELDFTNEELLKLLAYPSNLVRTYDPVEGAAKLTVTGPDMYIYVDYHSSDVSLYASDYKYLEVMYMIPKTNSAPAYTGQVFLCTGDNRGPFEEISTKITLDADGEYHYLRVKLSDLEFWSGEIHKLRFDFFNSAPVGDEIYIKTIRLTEESIYGSISDIDFTDELGKEFVAAKANTSVRYDKDAEATVFEVIKADPNVTVDYTLSDTILSADEYKTLKITYMIPTDNGKTGYQCDLFLCAGDYAKPSGDTRVRYNLKKDGQWHTLEIDLSQYSFWTGEIYQIRFDYFDSAAVGDLFYISSIILEK